MPTTTETSATTPSSFPFFGSLGGDGTAKADAEDQKCNQCMSHLTSILTNMQSKPKILFEAMGVSLLPTTSVVNNLNNYDRDSKKSSNVLTSGDERKIVNTMTTTQNENLFWTMDENGKGLRILIPKEHTTYKQSLANAHEHDDGPAMDGKNNNDRKIGFGGVSTLHRTEMEEDDSGKVKKTMLQRVQTKIKEKFNTSTTTTTTNDNDNHAPTPATVTTTTSTILSPVSSELATSSIRNSSSLLHQQQHNHPPNQHLKDDYIPLEIQCRECGTEGPEGSARAFLKGPTPLTIILCTNRLSLSDSEEINEVLTHELIHVYDVHSRKWNLSNCQTLAKSEIRAAREAECNAVSKYGLFWKEKCVKEKAKDATKNMFPYHGYDCVNAVFKDAMKDRTPFGINDNDQARKDNNSSKSSTMATSGTKKSEEQAGGGYFSERSFTSSYSA